MYHAIVVLIAPAARDRSFFVSVGPISPERSATSAEILRWESLACARLRCLRMTINHRRLYRSLDSATRNDFLGGNYGALHLGGRRTVLRGSRGVKGIWSGWVRALVPLRLRSGQALRGLNRICGLVAWLKPCPSLGFMPRGSIAVRNSGNGKEETSGAQVARNHPGCRSLHCFAILSSRFP